MENVGNLGMMYINLEFEEHQTPCNLFLDFSFNIIKPSKWKPLSSTTIELHQFYEQRKDYFI